MSDFTNLRGNNLTLPTQLLCVFSTLATLSAIVLPAILGLGPFDV
jgi:hypothetical protein